MYETSYEIVGTYQGISEILDTAETSEDANYLLNEYQMAFGKDWIIKIRPC